MKKIKFKVKYFRKEDREKIEAIMEYNRAHEDEAIVSTDINELMEKLHAYCEAHPEDRP